MGFITNRLRGLRDFLQLACSASTHHRRFMDRDGLPPTRAEIAESLGLKNRQASTSTCSAAGAPILATAHLDEHVLVDVSLFKPRADFSLRDDCTLEPDGNARHRVVVCAIRLGVRRKWWRHAWQRLLLRSKMSLVVQDREREQ